MDKITEQDLANRGVKGLPDVPGLTTEEMQRKLEEIAREILIPKVNELVEGLNNANRNLNSLIKTDTATVTTDASGNAMLPLSRDKILVSVDCTSQNGVRCMTMTANNNWYVFTLANSLTFSPYANKSMTFKYYYV